MRNSPQKVMHEDLMERVVTQDNATVAWLAVKRNGGAPGIDGMTTEQLRDHVEGWIRQHLRACFWQRWDNWRGRLRKLRALGLSGRLLKVAHSSKGAWRLAASPSLQTALSNAVLRRHGFWMPSDLAATV